jgi:hypothetical protein
MPLHLVDNHESAQRPKGGHRLSKTPLAYRILQVEIVGPYCRNLPGDGRFATLPRSTERCYGVGPDGSLNFFHQLNALSQHSLFLEY